MLRLEKVRMKHAQLYTLTRGDPMSGFKLNAKDVLRFCKITAPEGQQFEIQMQNARNPESVYRFLIPEQVVCDVGLLVDEEITSETRRQLFQRDGSSITSQMNAPAWVSPGDDGLQGSQVFYAPERSVEFREMERELGYNGDDGALYQTKLTQLPFLFERVPRVRQQCQKVAKDIPRSSFLPNALGRDLIQLFLGEFESGNGLYAFLAPEAEPLNKVLFQTLVDFQFQVDCLLVYRVQAVVSELLGHYQQGYNDLVCVLLNLLLDQFIAEQDARIFDAGDARGNREGGEGTGRALKAARNYPQLQGVTLDALQLRTAQLAHLLLTRLQPVLQMFTVAPQKAQRQRRDLSHQFYAELKNIDPALFQFLQQTQQRDQIILHLMEWVLSLFSRVFFPQDKKRLLDIWRNLIANPSPKNALRHCCVVLSEAKRHLFERCGVAGEAEYIKVYGAQGMEFFQAIGAWSAPATQ